MVISEHQFDVILYANISEKLISSLDLTYSGPEASLSALKFFLDLGSDGYRQCYTYSVQLVVEGFFFVCALFSSCFFILKWSESKHEAIVFWPTPYRERNKIMLFVFISF